MRIYTIGVYDSTEEQFFGKLTDNGIDMLCDVRQRRGVRGSKYAFANSRYLQARLAQLGIAYEYLRELAPTREIRQKQWEEDKRLGESKHDRTKIGSAFAEGYIRDIMSNFDFDDFVEKKRLSGVEKIAFLCIEACAGACHRSLIAEELGKRYHLETVDL